MEKKEQILGQAEELFMRFGIKSMTMDDLARQMGISKKTLYQFFTDKSDLVTAVFENHINHESSLVGTIFGSENDAISELFAVAKLIGTKLTQLHPSVHYDLEKYYPEAWKKFREHKNTFVYSCVSGNMEKGIRQGLYRPEINVPILTKIYISRIDSVFDPEVFPPALFSFGQVYQEMIQYHIRGLATAEGIKRLEQILNNP